MQHLNPYTKVLIKPIKINERTLHIKNKEPETYLILTGELPGVGEGSYIQAVIPADSKQCIRLVNLCKECKETGELICLQGTLFNKQIDIRDILDYKTLEVTYNDIRPDCYIRYLVLNILQFGKSLTPLNDIDPTCNSYLSSINLVQMTGIVRNSSVSFRKAYQDKEACCMNNLYIQIDDNDNLIDSSDWFWVIQRFNNNYWKTHSATDFLNKTVKVKAFIKPYQDTVKLFLKNDTESVKINLNRLKICAIRIN